MADYHPLIARAVAGLEKNTGEERRKLYERARTALVTQLRGVVPALEESEITRERLSLEEAIRKVEAESVRHVRDSMRPTLAKRVETPRREEPPRPVRPAPPVARAPIAPIAPSPPREEPAAEARPAVANPLDDPVETAAPIPPPPPPPTPPVIEDEPEVRPPPAPLPVESHPLQEYGQLEPQMQPENLWALPLDNSQPEPPIDLDRPQPRQRRQPPPQEPDEETFAPPRPPRSYGTLIRVGLMTVLILLIVVLGYWQRATIGGVYSGIAAMLQSSATAPQRETAAPARPKIADRIGQPSTAPSSGPAVAQRVVLYEEEPDDPQGKRYIGTVLWKTEMRPATPGRAPEMAVRADISVPDRNMTATFSLRRNTDPSLPASHTIEIVFNLPQDSPSGGVQKVPGVLMKQAEQTRGVPLAGLAVPVTPGYFLIGLSSLEADMQRNLQLLKERSWFDIPIIYNNNRRAILALEKGTPGEQAFTQAFAAWKQ